MTDLSTLLTESERRMHRRIDESEKLITQRLDDMAACVNGDARFRSTKEYILNTPVRRNGSYGRKSSFRKNLVRVFVAFIAIVVILGTLLSILLSISDCVIRLNVLELKENASGLQWKYIGTEQPNHKWVQIFNETLEDLIQKKNEAQNQPSTPVQLEEKEWASCRIDDLKMGNYIKSGSAYFRPHAVSTQVDEDLRLEITSERIFMVPRICRAIFWMLTILSIASQIRVDGRRSFNNMANWTNWIACFAGLLEG